MKVKLRDVSNIIMGQSPDSSTYNTEKIGLPFFQGNADFGELNPIAKTWCSAPIKIAYKNYILISVRAPIGALNIAAETCCIGRGLAAFDVNNKMCTQKYLWYLLKAKKNELLSKGTGSTFKAISKNILSEMEFNIPPVREQELCTKVLDVVFCLIRLKKEQLDKLDLLVKSRFVEMFGDLNSNEKNWGKESLKHHAKVIVGYPFKSKDYTETGIRIVGGYNLMQGYVVWSECKYWERIDGYEKYLLEADDIVMAMDRPWVNGGFKISKIDGRELPALLIQRTACIRAIDIEQDYLYMLLNSDCFAEHCNIKGSLVPHISNKDIDSFEIFIPPHELQMEFAYFIKQVDKSKFVVTAKFQ